MESIFCIIVGDILESSNRLHRTLPQTFFWVSSEFFKREFRTIKGNIFRGVKNFFEVGNSGMQTCNFEEKEPVSHAKVFLEFSKFQNHSSFLSTSREVSAMEFLVRLQAVDQSCDIIKRELPYICFHGYFPKISVQLFQNILMLKTFTREKSQIPIHLQVDMTASPYLIKIGDTQNKHLLDIRKTI